MVEEKAFLGLSTDRIFKTIVLEDKEHKFLNSILSDVLEMKVQVVEIYPSELPVINTGVKANILDVVVKTEDNTFIDIEINSNFSILIKERNLGYYCSLYSQIAKRGIGYENRKAIQINFNYNSNSKRLKEEYYIMEKTTGELFSENFKIINVNLAKYKSTWYDKNIKGNKEHIYLVMMSANKNELKNLSKNDELVKEVCDRMFILNDDDTITRTITPEEDARMYLESEKYYARKEGMEKGMEKGIAKATNNIVISMLKEGFDISVISKMTSLTKKEINNIKKKLK